MFRRVPARGRPTANLGQNPPPPSPSGPKPRGGPRPNPGSGGAAAASAGPGLGSIAMIAFATLVAIVAVVGVGITSHLLYENVKRLDKRIGADRVLIAELNTTVLEQEGIIADLEDDLELLNDTMPDGNGTVFFDDEWIMANGLVPSKQFVFDASAITTTHPPNRRAYTLPDADGTFAMIADIPPVKTTFSESEFALYLDGDPTTKLQFDVTLFTAGVTHVAVFPNKDGTVAYLSDVMALTGNTTTFLDSQFSIVNDPDTSRVAVFNVGLISTNTQREFTLPDKDGVIAMISDLGSVGNATFLDSEFEILNAADPTKVATFNASLIGAGLAHEFAFPNITGVLVVTDGVQTIDDKTLEQTNTYNIDMIKHTFYGSFGDTMAFAPVLPWSGHDTLRFGVDGYGIATGGDRVIPIANGAVSDMAFDDAQFRLYYSGATTRQLQFHLGEIGGIRQVWGPKNDGTMVIAQGGTGSIRREVIFDVSGITDGENRHITIPDKNGTMAMLSDLSGGGTVFSDIDFAIVNDADNTKQIRFDASAITSGTGRVYTGPDLSGEIVLTTGAQTVDDKSLEQTNTYNIDLNKHTFYGNFTRSMSIDPVLPWGGHQDVQIGWSGFSILDGDWGIPVTNMAVSSAAFDDSAFAVYYSGTATNKMTFNMGDTGGAHDIRGPRDSGMMVVCKNSVSTRGIVFDSGGNTQFSNIQVPDKDGVMALLSDIGGSISTYGFRLVKDGGLTLVSGTTTTVTDWHTANITFNYDTTGGDFDTASGVFTVGTGQDGYYSVSASIYVPVTSGTSVFLKIVSSATDLVFDLKAAVAGVASIYASTTAYLAAGDSVDVRAIQFSGSNATLSDGVNTHFACHRIS